MRENAGSFWPACTMRYALTYIGKRLASVGESSQNPVDRLAFRIQEDASKAHS